MDLSFKDKRAARKEFEADLLPRILECIEIIVSELDEDE